MTTKKKQHRRRRFAHAIRRRFKDKSIPILPTVAALVPAFEAYQHLGSPQAVMADPMGFSKQLIYEYTGYDVNQNNWDMNRAIRNGLLIGSAYLGHKAMNKIGVNKAIHRIPLVGKYISL